MSDLVAALRELHLASGDKFSMWSKAADRIESLQMIYDDAEKQSAEARIELVIFKQGALARIEALEAELAEANATIEAVREIHHAHSVLTGECVSCRGLVPCRTIRALESATPQGSLAGSTIQAKDDQC